MNQAVAQRLVVHFHGLLRPSLVSFLSRRLSGQLPMLLELQWALQTCARPAFLRMPVWRFSSLSFPMGTYYNKTRLHLLNNEHALWAPHRGCLFAKYLSRQATVQRGFTGHAIINLRSGVRLRHHSRLSFVFVVAHSNSTWISRLTQSTSAR